MVVSASSSDAGDDDDDLLYDELRRRAGNAMRAQGPRHTLQATELVHEVWLKLRHVGTWNSRSHFLAAASQAMRRILVDHARAKGSKKRAAPGEREELDDLAVLYESRAIDILALEDALKEFATLDPPMARAVEMRFYGGASWGEIAETLGVAQRTLERRWRGARQWLFSRLR